MAYEPQPGTIPHRAIAWLRMYHPNGAKVATAVICDELGIQTNGFVTSMKPAREAGLVVAVTIAGEGKGFWWGLGDGNSEDLPGDGDRDEAATEAPVVQVRPGPFFPGVAASVQAFRATIFEGKLLATGMQIIDGVAVFDPDQFAELRKVVAWAPA